MAKKDNTYRWGAVCAVLGGLGFLLPLAFYFFFLPAAGSSADHAANPASFLPWMAAHGGVRTGLWWATCLPFLALILGAPQAMRTLLRDDSPAAARVAELAGILGCFSLILASLMLAAGEPPLARAYAAAGAEARSAIIAVYEYQRLVTAIIFDFLGFFCLGVWTMTVSAAGLRTRRLPKALGVFGLITASLEFCFAIGYVAGLKWLGEFGIGLGSFAAMPIWAIWLGCFLRRHGREQAA